MKAVGIVVEYNPFHFGHLHHLNEAKRLTNADVVIAVMSSHVVQRGEFSVIDKFTRTKWALQAGVDLVVELPGLFVLQSADLFARTSVDLLRHLNVNAMCFGSETGDLAMLNKLVDLIDSEAYQTRLKTYLAEGKSYPTSSAAALKDLAKDQLRVNPNDTLAIQYIRALRALAPNTDIVAIKRIASGYYDALSASTHIQSATAIRKAYKAKQPFEQYVPEYVYKDMIHCSPVDMENFFPFMSYKLASSNAQELHQIFGVEEGLEHRFLSSYPASSFEELVDNILSPRYTHAKIKRTLMHVLIGTQSSHLQDFNVPYIRVLGMTAQGQKYLSKVKKDLHIPLITKIKGDRHPLLDAELRITAIYDLIKQDELLKKEFEPVNIL